jgi:ATP synthase protein I
MTEDFDRRLAEAEQRRSGPVRPERKDEASAWGIGTRVGVELLSALIVGLGIGWGLDRWLHMSPLFLVVGVFLGGAAGIANVWRLMAPKR